MNSIQVDIACPECNFHVHAKVTRPFQSFLILICPKCFNNVVLYDNKIRTISRRLLSKLIRQRKVKVCGVVNADLKKGIETRRDSPGRPLTPGDVTDLKILLETSGDVNDFLASI